MSQQKLTLSTLGLLRDGLAESMVNAALTAAVQDTSDRGSDGKARKVVITVVMEQMDGGEIKFGVEAATEKIPSYKVAPTVGEVTTGAAGKPELLFRDDSPRDPRQGTTFDHLPRDQE